MSAYRTADLRAPEVLELRTGPMTKTILLGSGAMMLVLGATLEFLATVERRREDVPGLVILGLVLLAASVMFLMKGLELRTIATRLLLDGPWLVVEARRGRHVLTAERVRADDIVDIAVIRSRSSLNDVERFSLEVRMAEALIPFEGFSDTQSACRTKRDDVTGFLRLTARERVGSGDHARDRSA